ncbi:putative ATP-grasp-modified RiPP [Streptomyces sp. NPDC058280]|uniref:putative ATP-grasp-modified RiPP n=1 Tax=Streptomyces sp. NPDC058280 TaxID=3346419 RepID=UPI0036E5365B
MVAMYALTLFPDPTPTDPVPVSDTKYDPDLQITIRPAGHPLPTTMSHIDRVPNEKDDGCTSLW